MIAGLIVLAAAVVRRFHRDTHAGHHLSVAGVFPRNASASDYLSARLRCNVTVAVALSRYLSGKLAVGAVLQHLPGRLVCHFCVLVYAAEYLGALPVSEITHG